jgi:hypothetical protein
MHLRASDLIDPEFLIALVTLGLLFALAILAALVFSGHLTPDLL